MRILDKTWVMPGLDELGMGAESLASIERVLHKPSGMLIVAGPTGSGKSTLLYACLNRVNGPGVKILTVEDPVETVLNRVSQVQVNKKVGVTFASAARTFLRQDPDVMMVGEMRDLETTQISMEAALTGHLVLTTLHTEDSPGTLLRLSDMGIERHLIAATVAAVVSLRLARRLCPHCKKALEPKEAAMLGQKVRDLSTAGGYSVPDVPTLHEAVGCDDCRFTGYRGRIGLHETLTSNPKLVSQILLCATTDEMTRLAVANGMRTLFADGVSKAVDGDTTIDEVIRVTAPGV